MTCTFPRTGFRVPGGQLKFSRKGAWVDRPVTVACGQCMDCRIAKAREWSIRCVHEAQMHEVNSFVTLTYDEDHLPHDGGLDVEDWQNFAKKVRREIGPFRFLHCGEYGDQNLRPHYHAVIFGQDFEPQSWRPISSREGRTIYTSELLEECWAHKGHVSVDTFTRSAAHYVARYTTKKVSGPLACATAAYQRTDPDTGETFDVRPEYVTMSRRPGLGASWFDRYWRDCYPSDFVVIDGKKSPVPEYYDYLLEQKDPELFDQVKRKRVKRAAKHAENQTPERLAVRGEITRRSWKEQTRSI